MNDQQSAADNFFEFPLTSGKPSPEIVPGREGFLSFEIAPAGGNVTGLKLQIRLHPNGSYIDDLVDAAFASTTITEILRQSATGPNATTDGTVGWAKLRLGLVAAVRFLPTLSAGNVTIRGVK